MYGVGKGKSFNILFLIIVDILFLYHTKIQQVIVSERLAGEKEMGACTPGETLPRSAESAAPAAIIRPFDRCRVRCHWVSQGVGCGPLYYFCNFL